MGKTPEVKTFDDYGFDVAPKESPKKKVNTAKRATAKDGEPLVTVKVTPQVAERLRMAKALLSIERREKMTMSRLLETLLDEGMPATSKQIGDIFRRK